LRQVLPKTFQSRFLRTLLFGLASAVAALSLGTLGAVAIVAFLAFVSWISA
jgi:hypothetical protein